ncbi:substrate-binding domain-containing protein [Sphingomonas sp.]|jgi:mxaJ protein|uniref:substrate-binding domain-containing protein n=1 Tax=Sphingomonas sp. TaxID=28214 RepID=UPI002E37D9EA|nr:substrate-binding domain-containing protein [Sphingomonas sp.]HEX4694716.1 substrate-binding domain-containing protein [Sphingomonas sp.]
MKRAAVLVAVLLAGCSVHAAKPVLTVCADPNNLPFSNKAGQGFENRIADLVAHDLGRDVRYVWWAQRRGYVRNTLNEAKCDIWPGVASGVEMVATTRPYYRSTYVFVTRADRPLAGLTLDDPRLKTLSIGIQMVGDDGMNTPPAHALSARGIIRNVRGFMLYGDYARPNPPAEIVRAVADKRIDVAMAWGPLAGYFAKRSAVPLRVEPVTPWLDRAQWPMVYDISMGVRKTDPALKQQVETILRREKPAIGAILARYDVPQIKAE